MTDWFEPAFMRHALFACVFGGASLSMVGVCLTLLDIPFLGISMSHAAFLGAVLGLFFGFDPFLGALCTCAAAGLAVGPVADRSGSSSNVMLGMLFSATMGLAFLLLSQLPGPKSEALNLIWGSILTLSRRDVLLLAAIFAIGTLLLVLYYKELAAVLFSREIAAASGIAEKRFFYGLILVSGLIVSASLNIVGGLLIFSLLVNPASAAYQLTYRLSNLFLLSALFGIVSCLAGLALSCVFDVPPGAVIVLTSAGIFLAALALSPKRAAQRDHRLRGRQPGIPSQEENTT